MIKLYDSEIIDVVPENLRDAESRALSFAIQQAFKRVLEYAKKTSIYALIDKLPDDLLDLLAVEFRTHYYNQDLDIDIKRALIKNTLLWYSKAGTPASVYELVRAVLGSGWIQEWYEYDGHPGCFRIQTENNQAIREIREFMWMLESIKRKSAWLDSIQILFYGSMDLFFYSVSAHVSWTEQEVAYHAV